MSAAPKEFVNPISAGFRVLEEYREVLRTALEQQGNGLSDEDRTRVFESMEVDRGLIFSKTTSPKVGQPIEDVIREVGYHPALVDLLDEQFDGNPFFEHQEKAIRAISGEAGGTRHTVVATGTGSGKTESFLVPAFNECLQNPGPGVKALLLYPMNALANDQMRRIAGWAHLCEHHDVTYGAYVGSTPKTPEEAEEQGIEALGDGHMLSRQEMVASPPDILLTNYVMLDYMLTRKRETELFEQSADSLAFLVVDEIHTYSGTNAAHLMHLLRRLHARLRRDPVKIATSATLVPEGDERQGAFMRAADTEKALAEYIEPLLGIDDFHHFTLDPRTESEDSVVPDDAAEKSKDVTESRARLEDVEELDWLLTKDREANARLIETVTGETIPPHRIHFDKGQVYARLDQDPYVHAMRDALDTKAQSFQDLVQLCRQTYGLGPESDVESVVRAYLSLIAYMNAHHPKEQLLDFRMHLFVRNVGGRLKTCLQCGQYHAGRQEHCPDCGNPLFLTYSGDVSKCVARVSGQRLSYDLRRRSDDSKKPIYVLVSAEDSLEEDPRGEVRSEKDQVETTVAAAEGGKAESGPEDTMTDQGGAMPSITTGALDFFEDSAAINFGTPGRYRLELMDGVVGAGDALEHTVRLFDPNRDFDYLCRLSHSLLEYDQGKTHHGRLLGFVDSRERVSRYGMGLRDEFASQYLATRLVDVQSEPQPLPALAQLVDAWRPDEDGEAPEDAEAAVLREAPLWFHRCVGRSPVSGEDYLTLDPDLSLPEDEKDLLKQLFLDTRAIYRGPGGSDGSHPYYAFQKAHREAPPEDTSYIALRKHLGCRRHGIYIEEGAQSPKRNYTGLALTDRSRRLQNIIRAYKDRTGKDLEHLHMLIDEWVSTSDPESAVQNGSILIAHPVPGNHDHVHYYLNPKYVHLHPETLLKAVTVRRGERSLDRRLRTAASHSSEKSAEERTAIEEAFDSDSRTGKQQLDVLMATPTLEMGVDIGKLRTVLMVGVPPMPSNYAQRAGRAGRKPSDGQALIVTLCFGSREHDNFYFSDPSRMVNGWVTAPRFNSHSASVARKHLHAWMLEGYAHSAKTLRGFARNVHTHVKERLDKARQLFGTVDGIDVETYLNGPFREALTRVIEKAERSRSAQQYLYKSGFFPDYTFRQDEIPLVDAGKVDDPGAIKDVEENQISSRTPERAYYKYAPSSTVYAGGRVYKVGTEAPYDSVRIDGKSTRSFEYLPAYVNERNTSPYDVREIYDRTEVFEVVEAQADAWEKPIDFEYYPSLGIGFRNDGLRTSNGTESFFDAEDQSFAVGYKLQRSAVRISIDEQVCSDRSVDVSLAFALDRAIKDQFRLGEGEVGMIVHPDWNCSDEADPDAQKLEDRPSKEYRHIILYDGNGNENVPFDRVAEKLQSPKWFRSIYEHIESCDCDNGCYECMRSHSTQFHAEALRKEQGLMALKYLAGDGIFHPSPSEADTGPTRPDLILTVQLRDKVFVVNSRQSNATVRKEYGDDVSYNEAMFDALTTAVLNEWTPDMQHLRVKTNVTTLVNAINRHDVNLGREAFARLQFAFLRFQNIVAEKID